MGGAGCRTVDCWNKKGFLEQQERAVRIRTIPSLRTMDQRIDLIGALIRVVLAWARTYAGQS